MMAVLCDVPLDTMLTMGVADFDEVWRDYAFLADTPRRLKKNSDSPSSSSRGGRGGRQEVMGMTAREFMRWLDAPPEESETP